MSQAGFTPIQLYHSTTAAAAPTAGNLANGELSINITDGKLFYKDNLGVVQVLATKAGASGDVVGPASSTDNALVRFDTTTGKLVQNSVGILDDSGNLTGLAAVTMSGALTLSGGTANGVAYLNGSKVLTTGSALTFDGTVLTSTTSAATAGNFKATSSTAQVFNATASNDANTTIGLGVFGSAASSFGMIAAGQPLLGTAASALNIYSSNASGAIKFGLGSTPAEQMRLTSTGLGIGTTSPADKLDVRGNIVLSAASAVNGGYQEIRFPAGVYTKAAIRGYSVGTTDAGELRFYTAPAGDLVAERARIDSSGNLLVGKTTTSIGTSGFVAKADGITVTNANAEAANFNRESSDGGVVLFRRASTQVGSITVTTVLTTYNTTSDYRLKTVIGPVADAGQRIDALQPVEYTWNADGSRTRGFLAHQFQEVYAGSVTGSKDAVDAEGKPVYQQMQPSTPEVIADLVAEIQSLRARVAALESN